MLIKSTSIIKFEFILADLRYDTAVLDGYKTEVLLTKLLEG